MPQGTTLPRLQNIAIEGAQVDIQELNYDDCVRLAAKEADETPRGVIVQDTAWDGYEEIPAWIMQGYVTMAMEAGEQLKAQGCERPTHIFVQAGVGSLAGAVVGTSPICMLTTYLHSQLLRLKLLHVFTRVLLPVSLVLLHSVHQQL